MRTISKGREPRCLGDARRHANHAGHVWPPGGDCVASIRRALVGEQRQLCAYCMGRIKPRGYRPELSSQGGMKIEHWLARSDHETQMYAWDNLLGVCGGEHVDANGRVQHCDTARGSTLLHLHPGTQGAPRPEDALEFKGAPPGGGEAPFPGVWVHGRTEAARRDVETLNLNAEHLVRNRWAAIDVVRARLRRAGGDRAVRGVLRSLLGTTAPACATLPPYARVVREYVEAKAARHGLPV